MPNRKAKKNKGKKGTGRRQDKASDAFCWANLPLELKEEILKYLDINQLLKLEAAMGLEDTPAASYPPTEAAPPKEMFRRIAHALMLFDLDIHPMMDLMRRYDAIISGSCALAVILDSDFVPNDIDAYVKTESASPFVDGLVRKTKYERSSHPKDTKIYKGQRNGIVKSYNLVHAVTGKKINIIETGVCPISTVFAFHNTVLMNFIAYWGVVCSYGTLTCRRIGLVNSTSFNEGSSKTMAPATEESRQKYKARGVKMIWNYRGREDVRKSWADIRNHVCGEWEYCPKTSRNLNDSGVACLVFPEWRDKEIEITMVHWRLASEGRCKIDFGMKLGWVHSSEGQCIWLL
ncbi:hypothetical protein CC1G_04152 [Coprinopsis cinerea okayama7|uniref:F-box domain-containing protein n=1 Tax=Coprinopsis cinerea (strain Okayama-7 / 130 / ATCC MYA-4618 / FGSC 9003) TaxID=240176 RepID=A8NW63_COPC7|nr:hypothetical protein CC1G_04152 [Coprinopsis cinerea okayama7\|eukprot:XP_001836839.1 hypothetical protein CC1G_04152 [Coprinopsis cinerea okayama7\